LAGARAPYPARQGGNGDACRSHELRDEATANGVLVAVSFAAYLVGSVSEAIFRKQLETRLAIATYGVMINTYIPFPRGWALRAALRRYFGARRVGYGLSHKGDRGVWTVSRRVRQELAKTPNASQRLRAAGIHLDDDDSGLEPAKLVNLRRVGDRMHDAIASDLDLIERRLIGSHPALYSEADRLRAEHEFPPCDRAASDRNRGGVGFSGARDLAPLGSSRSHCFTSRAY
jgi:hypothetical protein